MNIIKLFIVLLFLITSSKLFSFDDIDQFKVKSSEDHELIIFNEGITSFIKRLELIDQAQESIKLESFIYTLDPIGKVFMDRLKEKAEQGVKVQILTDPLVSSSSLSPFHIYELNKSGIEIKYHNTYPILAIRSVQYRNHRKMFVVDNKVAIVGGRNIADEYFDISPDYNFIDRDLLVEGPIVSEMAETFDAFWNSRYSVAPERTERPDPDSRRWFMGRGDPQRKYERAERNWINRVLTAREEIHASQDDNSLINQAFTLALAMENQDQEGICSDITFVSDKPGIGRREQRRQRILKYEIFEKLTDTEGPIYIENPYFIVDRETSEVLNHLAENSIPTKVLTNSLHSTDNIAVAAVFNSTMGRWIRRGIETYIYQASPLNTTIQAPITEGARWGVHSKTFVFDSDSFMIGSYNFDPRSNNFNMELGLFCDGSEELTQALVNDIDNRLEHSEFIDSVRTFNRAKFRNVDFMKRLSYFVQLFPALLFDHLL